MGHAFRWSAAATAVLLASCGGGGDPIPEQLPQLAAAVGAPRQQCASLTTFSFPAVTITGATVVAPGTLTVAGTPVDEHCQVTGVMNERQGVNGQYAIRFEMRLPTNWNGRFFHQVNGGTDGNAGVAAGGVLGGGQLTNALQQGFAVVSSDAGHTGAQNAAGASHFGLDPRARLDYGYQAVGSVTPMAKSLIQSAYGKAPDRSYIGGCSNGGRHALVAAARYPDQFDGYLVGSPGFNLPKAGVQEAWDTQQLARVATATLPSGLPNISTAFTPAERTLVASAIVGKCDALDGANDGMVLHVRACQATFNVATDVSTCSGPRDGNCLTTTQKDVLTKIFGGARNSAGSPLYSTFPFDRGIANPDWATWKYVLNVGLGATALPYIFTTPPTTVASADLLAYMLNFNMDVDAPRIFTTSGNYAQSAMEFMTPPNPTDLSRVKNRGAKMLITHGTADAVFSVDDTTRWYDELSAANGGSASNFSRLFPVPGMGHCSGGAATDQFDALTPLVNWVERGIAPDRIVASVRKTGNPGGVNNDVPAAWSATRTRPLCPHPQVASLRSGATDLESANSFVCE